MRILLSSVVAVIVDYVNDAADDDDVTSTSKVLSCVLPA